MPENRESLIEGVRASLASLGFRQIQASARTTRFENRYGDHFQMDCLSQRLRIYTVIPVSEKIHLSLLLDYLNRMESEEHIQIRRLEGGAGSSMQSLELVLELQLPIALDTLQAALGDYLWHCAGLQAARPLYTPEKAQDLPADWGQPQSETPLFETHFQPYRTDPGIIYKDRYYWKVFDDDDTLPPF